jgi:hypothetical protein
MVEADVTEVPITREAPPRVGNFESARQGNLDVLSEERSVPWLVPRNIILALDGTRVHNFPQYGLFGIG